MSGREACMVRFAVLLLGLGSPAWADGDVPRGEKLFQGSCSACHGLQADGNGPAAASMKPPPTNFTAEVWWKDRTDPEVSAAIQSGTPGTAMMPFSYLSPQQLEDLVSFLRSKSPVAEPDQAPARSPSAPKSP
jgi:mono/diheme cytochrome c family protein